jgi:polysaccharide biosynthesis protein PslG
LSRNVNLRRIQVWALSIVVLSLVIVLCKLSWGAVGPSKIGMMVRLVNTDPATVTREFDLMAAMHVTWVRADFDWSAIEVNRGEFNWAYSDGVVKEASARRMTVLPILSHTPVWARPAGTNSSTPPGHVSDFADFARAAAARYAPLGLHTWEIWNEPNISDFWQPAPDANRYGELFRAAAATVRAVDPIATLLIGGLTRGSDTADGSRISQTKYVEQLYANGAAQLATAIAVHPYSFPSLPIGANAGVVGGIDDVPALHQVMERHGDGGKMVWITEFGAPTGTDSDAVSDIDQAIAIMQARKLVQKWRWAGPLIYFELRDRGTNLAVDEENFGVVRTDLSLKPAGKALIAQHIT